MFNETEIKQCLTSLGHFSQTVDSKYEKIHPSLLTSDTGRIISMVHPMITTENLYSVAPAFKSFDYAVWDADTTYANGESVAFNGVAYIAFNSPSAGMEPSADGAEDFWMNPFSYWLKTMAEQSAIEMVSNLMKNKKLQHFSKSIIQSLRLYEGGGLLTDREIGRGRFVGYQIEVLANENIVVSIDKIGFQTDAAVSVPVYLYHSSVAEPLAIKTVSTANSFTFVWNEVEAVSLKNSDGYDSGGFFFIGYYEDDLVGAQAISKKFDITRVCSSCNKFNAESYYSWSKRIKLQAIEVPAEALNDVGEGNMHLFDTAEIVYTNDRNYGLNFAITVKCDVTEFFCKHKLIFADLYAKQVAVNLLRTMAYTTRINAVPEIARQTALAELDPKKGSGSLLDDLTKAYEAVDFDTQGYDSECLPCSTKGKISYGAL